MHYDYVLGFKFLFIRSLSVFCFPFLCSPAIPLLFTHYLPAYFLRFLCYLPASVLRLRHYLPASVLLFTHYSPRTFCASCVTCLRQFCAYGITCLRQFCAYGITCLRQFCSLHITLRVLFALPVLLACVSFEFAAFLYLYFLNLPPRSMLLSGRQVHVLIPFSLLRPFRISIRASLPRRFRLRPF